ncbi:uncharacterized protein TRUGW13939_01586 [Talaromyces rugulosus]|uniref:Alpha/beta hydrolase fold-3 domain-containing protein n=1 Tax=Talaromyces rugulosus TaxID=121627 RepID=A0A7H8QKM9_TALRU|nr:uncharacterized protein TRUGW13939_01586 [Talaromyces rugulosus]QKX54499.1 hypothetical protein TRUGW13939_01586 [Talaromyces rugulosus]
MENYTKEALLKLGEMDPELEEILTVSPFPVVDYSVVPLEMIRQNIITMEKMACDACPTYDTKEFDVSIQMRDGYENTMRVIKPSPATSSGGSPLIALFHGGTFSMGTKIQLVPWARAIANLHGAVTVSLEYRLAPEYKFPQAAHDAWDSVQWLAANVLGVDLSRGFVVGGVSSGANLTLVNPGNSPAGFEGEPISANNRRFRNDAAAVERKDGT